MPIKGDLGAGRVHLMTNSRSGRPPKSQDIALCRRAKIKPELRLKKPSVDLGFTADLHTKCTPALIKAFCDKIRKGRTAGCVCAYLGIANTTFYAWMRKGNDYFNSAGSLIELKPYGLFVRQYNRAIAEWEDYLTDQVMTCEDKNWYKWIVVAERRLKKTWAKDSIPGGADDVINIDEKFV